jgi:hypothetical protein
MNQARQDSSRVQRALVAAGFGVREVLLTVLQVLVFFLIFLVILQLSLPKGTGLQSVYGDLGSAATDRAIVTQNGDTPVDDTGNVAYHPHYVYAKFQEPARPRP